ncbi:hypothetical protein [Methylobacterium dankookense]|uniref:Glycine betaine transport system permease protein OpuAB n=1 Tax=Methylobacterium dankookense TaxID=560405 RepID=A0A564FTJ9_9HYPH|nr:hypothetical protein IFDJLNFL_5357 [Methylobacterium dankookense]VUF10751.1 Glycine betaine transport system permease protein OpuAB [Methylobacterium dankookense]
MAIQTLFEVQLPLALSTIMAGVNQTMILALSMVVFAAMTRASDLGRAVTSDASPLPGPCE